MNKTDFHGIYPYLVPPLHENGKLNGRILERLCDHLIKAGIHGLLPLGSTGEFTHLAWPQRRRIVEVVIAAAKRLRPGSGGNGLDQPSQRGLSSQTV